MKNKQHLLVMIGIIAMFSFTIPAQARFIHPLPSKDLQVTYRGTEGDFLIFMVALDNTGKRKALSITDENGRTLFNQVFNGEKVERKFKIPKSELQRVTFTVNEPRNTYSKSFTISTLYIEKIDVQEQ